MRQAFDSKLRLNKENRAKLVQINEIIEEYSAQGYKLTLRQLYYQLVSRGEIPNDQREYAKLSNLLKKGRMAGYVDWDCIEDRLRVPKIPYYVEGVDDALDDTINQYRLDRMAGQEVYIEVWSEKDALSNILYRITNKYHVRLVINRGYGSVTAMYDAYRRFRVQILAGRKCILLYFGDHDPSGLDMVRDITSRLRQFISYGFYDEEKDAYPDQDDYLAWVNAQFKVEHVGLTTAQVKQYAPPPNPAKQTDPRIKWYELEHGDVSWEVDALSPEVLAELLSSHIEKVTDREMYEEVIAQEEKDKEELREMRGDYE